MSEQLELSRSQNVRSGANPTFDGCLGIDLNHPEIARAFYDLGPGWTLSNLSAKLRDVVSRGEIALVSSELAAEHLVGLRQSMSNDRLASGADCEAYLAYVERDVCEDVALFLNGCHPDDPN
jgi:hypothetical protein